MPKTETEPVPTIKVAYWYSDVAKNRVEEFRNVVAWRIGPAGELSLFQSSGYFPDIVVAPGEWHELVFESEPEN